MVNTRLVGFDGLYGDAIGDVFQCIWHMLTDDDVMNHMPASSSSAVSQHRIPVRGKSNIEEV
jgi:hypothetical protein